MSLKSRKPQRTAELTLQIDRSTLAEMMRANAGREASFVVIGGTQVGQTIPLSSDEAVVLGRDPECAGVINDDGISREHAEVRCEGPERYVIMDLNSTNGVFVDGQRIQTHLLKEGDKVLLGRRTILKFVLQDKLDLNYQQQMYESAVRDALTGSFNRKHFDERISSELSFARRHHVPISLVMMDLDHFKRVNDTWGHQAGDQVLISVSKAMMETLREEDIFARYGGEEFVIIARGIDLVGARAMGERLRALVESMVICTPGKERIPVTISLGIGTVLGGEEVLAADLIKRADENLYAAKESGRNSVVASRIHIR